MPVVTPSRRDFLNTSASLATGSLLTSASLKAAPEIQSRTDAVIFIMLTGAPSQIDTWDPKPLAPSQIRGPFRTIPTVVPGLHLSELFPRMANLTNQFSLIRSMTSAAQPIHELGFQLLNSGYTQPRLDPWPSLGSIVATLKAPNNPSAWWHLGGQLDAGTQMPSGQQGAFLPVKPVIPTASSNHSNDFGSCCDHAIEAIQQGARFVSINMYSSLFDSVTWDCHADGGSLATDLNDYSATVAPTFDHGFSRLLTKLLALGLLRRTLVVATGEFGRTPRPNCNGGRDHWTRCWTSLVAGGGIQGGQVVGQSDSYAAEPVDRPVQPQELVATVYHALGMPAGTMLDTPHGASRRLIEAPPILELF